MIVNSMTNMGDSDATGGLPYIIGTGTVAGVWTGTYEDITEYYEGLTITFKVNIAGVSGGTTLNINGLGAVPVVRNATTAVTTTYPVGSVLLLIYSVDSDGVARWKTADYDANSKNTAGTSNKVGAKMFLVGATSQASSATTYTNKEVYVGANNKLHSTAGFEGTADAATKLAAAKSIALEGVVEGSVSFDGSSDATMNVTAAKTITITGTDANGTVHTWTVCGG